MLSLCFRHVQHWCVCPPVLRLVQHKEGIVDSLPQSLLEGRSGSSLLLTPHQIQQLQQLTSAAGEGGGVTVTLQHGQAGGQLVLTPQNPHTFYPDILAGHTTHSILHHHVRQASIIQQVGQTSIQQMGMGVGNQGSVKPGSPFSSRSLTPSPSHQQRVITPQPLHQVMGAPPQVLQIFHQQATRNTVTGGGVSSVKTKQPPQILPKPPGSVSTPKVSVPQPASSPQITMPTQQQQTILLNQMMGPGGPMLVQQQTSSGVQLILRSPPPSQHNKQNTVVLSNGGLTQQGTVLVQGRQQAQPQFVRLVSGQTLQLQQIQTSSGPAIIAVPAPSTPTPPPQPPPSPTLIKKAKKKKKKEEEPMRLDLANLMKLSGIEDEDVAPVSGAQQTHTPQRPPTPPPPPSPKHTPHLVAQLQPQSHCPNQGLRVSVGEDGRMILHQNHPQVSGGVTPSIAAAAQSQLAQLLAHHGDGILQNNSSFSSGANKDNSALLQSLQTAVLSWANTDSLVMKSGGVTMAGAPQVVMGVRRPSNTPTSVVVANPSLLDPGQNGMRIVTDLNGMQQAPSRIQMMPTGATVSLSEQNRVQIVNSLSEQQNRVQIVNSLSEQQNRVQIVNSMSEQQNRVHIVSNSLSEQQNRVQIVTSVPHSQAVSFNDHNRFHAIVSRAPTTSMSLEQQNRVHIVSGVPTSTTMSLTEQQNRVQIVSGSQMSTGVSMTDQQSRVQIVSGVPSSSALSLTEQQNRVQIVSGVPNSTLTEQQNRVQIVSGIPSSSSMALTEQNRVQIVSGVANPSAMSLSEQNRVQIVSAVPQSSAMALEQQNRVQIVSGVHSSSAMSMTEQQNRVQIVSGITNKAMAMTEQQNRVQIISGVPTATSMSLSEQQNRVQIVSGIQNSNSLSLEQQNRVQIVSGMQSNGMSLAEQQNRVHIVSGLANSSMSCEQNRVQIVSGVSNSGIHINESPPNRVHMVSASSNTAEQPSRVQVVSGIPNRTAPTLSDRIQIMQNDQNRVHIATSMPSLSFSDHQNRVHIVSGTPSSNPVISEQNRVQIVTGVPNTNILSLSEQQSRVQILSNTSHNSVSIAPDQQRVQFVTGLSSDPTVQFITTMANTEHCRVSSSGGLSLNEHQRLHVVTSVAGPGGVGDQRVHIVTSSSMNDRLRLSNGANEPHRLVQSSGVQLEQVIRPQFQSKQPSRSPQVSQYQQSVISPRCNPTVSPQSPRGSSSKSPQQSQQQSPQQQQQQQQPPKPTFSNRPNLTVVTQSPPSSYQPQPTSTSQPVQHVENHSLVNHFPQFPVKPVTSASHLNHQLESSNHPSVITSLASCQTTTAITKPLQAVTRQPPRPPTTTTSAVTSFQNSFLDSIAQSHPSLVINKSPTPPIASKALKPKKLPKKSAVVKPMMHEERQGSQTTAPSCEKEPDPPNLVPINNQCETTHSSNVVQRVQTIQLTPQKQQHLKAVQSQITVLSSKKMRSAAENAALQRLFVEQQKILFSGKLIPTIPGQHAQGITFQVSAPVRVMPTPASSPRQFPPPPPPPPQPAPPPPPPPPPPTVSKATSPIHVQVGTQTSCEPSPSPPALSHTKRATLIEQQQRADRQGATGPDTNAPFASTSDAAKRLVRYHCLDEPVFSQGDLQKADEIFEATSRHLLDKNAQMLNKYKYLLLMESMRQVQTSELIMLGRMFVSDETARLEAAKIEANAPPPPVRKEREEKTSGVKKESESTTGEREHHVGGERGHEKTNKREREETDDGVSVNKKHCADDEEINAQVQNAIDSILNLGNNRSDPALDEAVRSILSS